ncbi:MAG: hypothetical protein Q9195_007462 [Heterodermia aff. obscurata]
MQLFCYGPCISVLVSQRDNEFGRHLWGLNDPAKYTREFLKILYIYIIFYYFAVVCIKFAIVCVISVIRLVVLSRLTAFDVTWNYVNAAIWSAAEPSMGVIASCIPSLRPLLSLLLRGTTRATGTLHSKNAQTTSSSHTMFSKRDRQGDEIDLVPTLSGGREGFARFVDEERGPGNARWGHEVEVKGGREKKSSGFPGVGGTRQQEDNISLEEIIPQGGIQVKSEVVVTSTEWEWKDRLY